MAKYDTPDPLPAPADTDNVTRSRNRFGALYRATNTWRRRYPGPRLACDRFPVPQPYGQLNWRRWRILQRRWKRTLTALQRLAWQALADVTPYRNYHGQIGFPNGYGIYLKFNHLHFLQSLPLVDNPPGTWNALEIPPVSSWTLFPGNALEVVVPGTFPPDPSDTLAGTVISLDPKITGSFPDHYTNDSLLTFNPSGPNNSTFVDLTCPFFRTRQARQCTVGLYTIGVTTGQFTDFFWMRLD